MEADQPMVPNTDGEPAIAEALASIEIKQSPTLDLIDAWFNEFFHNSLVSRDAQIFNYCQAAKEELKRRAAAL